MEVETYLGEYPRMSQLDYIVHTLSENQWIQGSWPRDSETAVRANNLAKGRACCIQYFSRYLALSKLQRDGFLL